MTYDTYFRWGQFDAIMVALIAVSVFNQRNPNRNQTARQFD